MYKDILDMLDVCIANMQHAADKLQECTMLVSNQ